MFLELLILIFLILFFTLRFWLNKRNDFWNRNKIFHVKSKSKLFGNLKEVFFFKRSSAECFQDCYEHESSRDEPIVGINLPERPGLVIRDPELIKRILIKDFDKFAMRYSFVDVKVDPIAGHNLFFGNNSNEWKSMRTKLTHIFTSGKLKQSFTLIENVGKELDEFLLNLKNKDNSVTKELREICSLYTTDVICSLALGINSNCIKDPNSEFRKKGHKIVDFNWMKAVKFNTVFFSPKLSELFRCKLFDSEAAGLFRSSVSYAMDEREKSKIPRNDLIDTLLEIREDLKKNGIVNQDMLTAQAGSFFAAGFDTTSSTMAFVIYELLMNQDIQKRLRNEIRDVFKKNNNTLTYDDVQNMNYLNMVVQETLRMYPPAPFLDRKCTLNSNEEGYSLEPFSSFEIPNGMPVFVPVYAIHRDPKYFSNPDKFDPERFLSSEKDKILPYTYMPFGSGPHNCIGERLGLLQVKMGLIFILKNHILKPNQNTERNLRLDPKAVLMRPEGGIFCDIIQDKLY